MTFAILQDRLSDAIRASLDADPEDLLREVLNALAAPLRAHAALAWLPQRGLLRCAASWIGSTADALPLAAIADRTIDAPSARLVARACTVRDVVSCDEAVALPVLLGDDILAILELFRIGACAPFAPAELEELRRATFLVGLALSRAQRLAETQTAQQRPQRADEREGIFASVGAALVASPQLRTTLSEVATALVPAMADWCVLDVLDGDHRVEPAIARHRDAEVEHALAVWLRGRPACAVAARRARATLAARVAESRRGELVASISDPQLVADALGAERGARSSELDCSSLIVVPLVGRSAVQGVLVLATARSRRPYDAWDLATAEDLGRRVGLASESARLFEEGQQRIQLRDDFLTSVAHELRTPATSLSLQLHAMKSALAARGSGACPAEERIRRALERTMQQHDRMLAVIDKLLDVAHSAHGELRLERAHVDLADVVRCVTERLAREAEHVSCELRCDLHPVDGWWDRRRLEQLVTSLVENALKCGHGHPVELATRASEHTAQLLVRDRSTGIPTEARQRVFRRFERAMPCDRSGWGLGLYAAKRIAEAHGGAIDVDGSTEPGATFTVELPRLDAAHARAGGVVASSRGDELQ